MPKVCRECGFAAPTPEPPVPPKAGGTVLEVEEPNKCLNCGKEGTMEDVADLPSGEEEQE